MRRLGKNRCFHQAVVNVYKLKLGCLAKITNYYVCPEDTHVLRLVSELTDLRTGYVHSTRVESCQTRRWEHLVVKAERNLQINPEWQYWRACAHQVQIGWNPQNEKNGIPMGWCHQVFAFGEDTHALRLVSELTDLRTGYVNWRACAHQVQIGWNSRTKKTLL